MEDRSSMVRIELPTDVAVLRPIARVLERERQWGALDSVLAAMLAIDPRDWRTHLWRYEANASARNEAGQEDAFRHAIDAVVQDPAATNAFLRVLESTGSRRLSLVLLRNCVERNSGDWRMVLRYAATLEDEGDDATAQEVIERLFAAEGPLTKVSRSGVLGRLQEMDRPVLLARAMATALQLNPGDWKFRLRTAQVHVEARQPGMACRLVEELFADRGRTTASRKIMLSHLLATGGSAQLVSSALLGSWAVDQKGLVSLLFSWKDPATLDRLREAILAWPADEPRTLALALAVTRAMESAGAYDIADETYAAIGSRVVVDPSPTQATPTASTMMFRNMPLLEQLLEVIEWIIARKGKVRVHVGACSSGEEAYSLALLLQRRGLLEVCELHATDVDPLLVQRASDGMLDARAEAAVAEQVRGLDLVRGTDDRTRIAPRVLSRIRFEVEDLSKPAPGDPFDLMVANNVLVHLPAQGRRAMLRHLAGRVEPDGVLCIGGARQDELESCIGELGLVAIEGNSAAVFEAWSIQRNAWHASPRPYWALPPARQTAATPWKHSTLFARSAATAAAIEALQVAGA